MATSKKNTLSPELKELVVNNTQLVFPAIVDRNIIYRVLKNENWDIEKAFHILEKLQHELSNNKNEIENSKLQKGGGAQTVQKSWRGKVQENEKPFKNKNNSELIKVPSVVGAKMKSQQGVNTPMEPKVKQQRKKEQKQENITAKIKFKKDLKRSYESIKHMKDPFDRIVNYGKSRIKVMVFMRGCPGSGKTTYAKEVLHSIGVANPAWFMFSADDFFIHPSTGKYVYNRELIQSAHIWNQKLVRQAASEGRSPLVIDNTHTKLWEMQDNAKVGVEYGYIIETLEPKTPWFFIEAELYRKTTHNVSRETIQRMIDRYEPNLTGLDVIHLTGLTYTRPPPVRQIAELNTPLSKKCIRLFENKVVINNDIQFPVFDQKANNTGKNVFVKYNQTNQSNSPHFIDQTNLSQVKQTTFTGKKSENRKYEALTKFQTNVTKGQQAAGDRNPFYQNETSGSNETYQTPFPFYNTLGVTSHDQSSSRWNESTSFWQETTSEINAQLNDDTNSNIISPFNVGNVATTFDLIDLCDDDIQPLIPSDSPDISNSSAPLPYKTVFPHYFNQSHELSSSDEGPMDSDDYDEDAEEEEDEDEEETDEDLLESDSLEDIRNTIDSMCSAFSSEVVTNEEKIINLCKEYVLVMPDETILYQKEHNHFPTNLNDFKICCTKEEEEKENKEAKSEDMTISDLSNYLIDYEFVLIKPDLTLIYQKSHADEPGTLKEFLEKSQKNNNEIIDENKSNDNPVLNNKACSVNITIDSNSVSLVNKSVSTEQSAAGQNVHLADRKNVNRFMEASSNTNYIDFEVLKQINTLDGGGDSRDDVITGRPIFESGPFIDNNHKHAQSAVLMLDKSSMTCDIQTNHINNADFGVDSLVQMFPTIKRENLEELLNKCGKDLDWAVGLLLDSGHEMSEFMPVMEQPKNSEINMFDNDCNVGNSDFDSNNSTATTSNGTASTKVISERKKKKKNHATLTDSSLDLIQNFQDKFKLNDECYSENIMKIRKHRMLNTDVTEPIKNTSECECRPIETNGESPETLAEEDSLEEEEDFIGEEEEEDDRESDVGLVVDKNLVIQLQNKFGGLLSPNLIGDKTILHIPKSLARQLYCYTFDAVYEHLEQQQSVIDMLINEGNGVDTQEDERLKSQPSFQEIMDHEIAVRMSQVKDNNRANTAASALSRTLLMKRFPNFDPSTLTSILEETNHSLHAATNLLTFAGHPVNTKESHEQVFAKEEENSPLSREEAIQQAHAYSDVAGKLCEMREDCLNKAENALAEGKKTVAQYYSEMAKWYMERIEQSNSLAANAMLNGHEGATTLDLHFLQVHQALKVLDLFLDDKIRTLMNKRKTTVYIITGRGSHSPKGLCRIKHAVQIRLRKRHIPFTEQNPGMLRAYITKRAIISYKKMVT